MEVKKEEEEYSISGTVLAPLDDPVEFKQEDVDVFPVNREIKEELMDEPFSNRAIDDSLGKKKFGCNGSMEGEESGVKEESGNMEPPEEEGTPPDLLYLKKIQTIRDIISQKTKKSNYEKDRKDRLEAALYAMCIGELTSSEAIEKFDVPSGTFYYYSKEIQTSMSMSGIFPPKEESSYQCVRVRIAEYLRNPNSTSSTEMRDKFAENQTTIEEDETLSIVRGPPLDPRDWKRIQTIRGAIRNGLKMCVYLGERKDRLEAGLFAVCIGELTSTEASDKFDIPTSTFQRYIMPIRQDLGATLPPQKPHSILPSVLNSIKMKTSRKEETVTIDGITVPFSISILTQWLTIGRIDYSQAQPFLGTSGELKEKLITILQSLNFGGVLMKLADGIMSVYVDGKTITRASRIHKFNQKTLSEYATALKIFIDFANSPCSWEYRSRSDSMVPQISPMDSGSKESAQPPPKIMDEWEVKKEEIDDDYGLIKEELIEPPVKKIKEE